MPLTGRRHVERDGYRAVPPLGAPVERRVGHLSPANSRSRLIQQLVSLFASDRIPRRP